MRRIAMHWGWAPVSKLWMGGVWCVRLPGWQSGGSRAVGVGGCSGCCLWLKTLLAAGCGVGLARASNGEEAACMPPARTLTPHQPPQHTHSPAGDVVRVDQAEMETVIPQPGGAVLVVNGLHRGAQATLKVCVGGWVGHAAGASTSWRWCTPAGPGVGLFFGQPWGVCDVRQR